MSFAPASMGFHVTGHITTYGPESLGDELAACWGTGPASTVWPTAAKAIYVPCEIGEPTTVVKGFWLNGATAAGNIDIGIYREDGTKVVTMGNTAQGTINIPQEVDIADTILMPGRYFLALSCSLGTATLFMSSPTAPLCQMMGIYTQVSANVLPASATYAADTTWAVMPWFGFSTKTLAVV